MICGVFFCDWFILPMSFRIISWWRHQMETFSALLALCAGNSPDTGEFPTQRPVTRSFDVYFDLRPDKRLSKQLWGWWFETLSHSLWRHRNVYNNGLPSVSVKRPWGYGLLKHDGEYFIIVETRQKSPCFDRTSPSGNSCCWTYPLFKIFRAKIANKWRVYMLCI